MRTHVTVHTMRARRFVARLAFASTACFAFLASAQGASAQGLSAPLPEWRPSLNGWSTASGEALAPVDGSAVPNSDLTDRISLRVGRLWHTLDASASTGANASWAWPGGIVRPFSSEPSAERFGSNSSLQGVVVGARNWVTVTPEQQVAYTYVTNEAYRFVADGYHQKFTGRPTDISVYGRLEAAQVQRWLPPQVIVDGVPIHPFTDSYGSNPGSPPAGDGAMRFGAVRGVIDPTLRSERMAYTAWRFPIGVDVIQQVHAWGSSPDNDYLLYDVNIVNTGNTDSDPTAERGGSLEDFRYAFAFGVDVNRTGNLFDGGADDIVEFVNPWPGYSVNGVEKVAALMYDGDSRSRFGPDWGAPGGGYLDGVDIPIQPRLHAPAALLVGWLFAEHAPGSGIDDPAQPKTTTWSNEDAYRITSLENDLRDQYQRIFAAKDFDPMFAPSADTVTYRLPVGVTQSDFGVSGRNPSVYQTLAYEDLAHGESVRAILVVAAGGVNDSVSRAIGHAVVTRDADRSVFANDRMTATEIALVRSNRDSAITTAQRAFWNVYGNDPNGGKWTPKPAVQNTTFNVPDPPKPPAAVWITSGNGYIDLAWTTDASTIPDTDLGTHDFAGYRVYRSVGSTTSPREVIAELPADAAGFRDSTVARDVDYYYAVTTFDDGSANWSEPQVSLESSVYWTWSGWSDGAAARAGGSVLTEAPTVDMVRVVPNPYHIDMTGTRGSIRDEISFVNLPSSATIRVYTAGGEFVHEIVHTSPYPASNATWDLRTVANRRIATGVYVYTVDTGDARKVGKFIVVQ